MSREMTANNTMMKKQQTGFLINRAVIMMAIVLIVGCSTQPVQQTNEFDKLALVPISSLNGVGASIPDDRINSLPRKLAQDGILQLEQGNLVEANQFFNQALMFDPTDSYLQWLNGVSYHLRAEQGESSQYEMAAEAYRLSISFDPTNWMAHYQLGLLFMDTDDYSSAQDAFAEALLFRPHDPDLLYQMLCVSYYNLDPETAAAALGQLQKIEPNSERTLRAAPVVMASVGEHNNARKELAKYQAQKPDTGGANSLSSRIQDWDNFYDHYNPAAMTLAAVQTESRPEAVILSASPPPQIEFASDLESEMVIVDVAIIESQEDLGTRKGVNLLNGLRLQYGLDRVTHDQRQEVSNPLDGSGSIIDTFSRTLTQAISIPRLEYSLNIFNSAIFTNEVLARPTLVALNGQQSHFFAGSNIQAAATASSNVGSVSGGEAVKINEDVGVDMKVTPTLRDDGLVRIDVDITRTFLETPDSSIDYEFKIQTAKTHVSASVVMAFGETLILSGMSEKESEVIREGVPILQDIPILQYFFSEQRTLDFQKSVLVLITPRKPFTLNSMVKNAEQSNPSDENDSMLQLQSRFDSWFQPAPHWVSVVQHLEQGGLYREFRTGDLALEVWAESQAFRKRFGDVVEFLYY